MSVRSRIWFSQDLPSLEEQFSDDPNTLNLYLRIPLEDSFELSTQKVVGIPWQRERPYFSHMIRGDQELFRDLLEEYKQEYLSAASYDHEAYTLATYRKKPNLYFATRRICSDALALAEDRMIGSARAYEERYNKYGVTITEGGTSRFPLVTRRA